MKKFHALFFVAAAVLVPLFSLLTSLTAAYWLLFGWATGLVRWFRATSPIGAVAVIVLFLAFIVLIHVYFTIRKTGGDWSFSRSIALAGLIFAFLLSGYALSTTLREGSRLTRQRETAFADESLLRKSKANMGSIGIAAHDFMEHYPKPISEPRYSDAYFKVWGDQTFPPGGTVLEDGRPGHGWTTQLLPYLGELALYERIDKSEPWDDPRNAAVYREETPTVFRSSTKPRDREFYRNREGFGVTDYAANQQAMPFGRPLPTKHFYSGISNTLLAGEVCEQLRPWGHPLNGRDPALGLNRTPLGFGSGRHRSTSVVFVFADAGVRAISVDIDQRILELLADPQGDNYYLDDIYDF